MQDELVLLTILSSKHLTEFLVTVVDIWNKLPENIVNSSSVNTLRIVTLRNKGGLIVSSRGWKSRARCRVALRV